MSRTIHILLLPILVMLLALASCGGGNVQLTETDSFQGIQQGDFRVVRFNDEGTRDGALNPTLDLSVQPGTSTTTVTIAVDDRSDAAGVIVDLRYDPARYSPESVDFGTLVDSPVEGAFTNVPGVVQLGQASISGPVRVSGEFATVTFRNEPLRAVSAAGDAHNLPPDTSYDAGGVTVPGLELSGNDARVDVDFTIRGIFARGDGDQNGETNAADLVPIAANFLGMVSLTNLGAARADYDQNSEVNAADITPIAGNFLEQTSGIQILLGDSGDSGDFSESHIVETLTWESGSAHTPGATDINDIWRSWTGTITPAQASAADINADGTVFFAARAANTTDTGPVSTPIALTVGQISNPNFTAITDVTFQIEGATGGGGAGDEFGDGDTAQLVANSAVTLRASGFGGTYDDGTTGPIVFTPGNPNGVPQEDYDDELERINQDITYAQAISVLSTEEFVLNINRNGGTAGDDPATVFPDDQTGNAAEGTLTVTFPGTNQANATITLDVTQDDEAALINMLVSTDGQDISGNWQVGNSGDTLRGSFTFPSNEPGTVDGDSIGMELWNLTSRELVRTFTYTADLNPGAGQFNAVDFGGGTFNFAARVGPGQILAGGTYMVRIFRKDTGTLRHDSSVNKPGQYFVFGGTPPPPAVVFETLPVDGFYGPGMNQLNIIYPDPIIRRNPEVTVDALGGGVTPVHGGSDDFLKNTGFEFQPAGLDGATYPRVTIIEGSDPSVIEHDTEPLLGPITSDRHYDRIVVDIAAVLPTAPTTYAFKVFGFPTTPGDSSTSPVLGTGTFVRSPDPGISVQVSAVDFGVNIFGEGASRGDLELGSADWSDKQLGVLGQPPTRSDDGTPDVLFVRFTDGRVHANGPFGDGNNLVVFEDEGGALGTFERPVDVRVAGYGSGVEYIGIVHLSQQDLFANGGFLVPTVNYNLALRSPASPTAVPFPDQLFVSN